MKLIGICGLARSGKDTAARYLAGSLGLHHYAFASPLKDMLTSVFGDHFYEGDRERICPEAGISYRKMMQLLGTEWGRAVNPDIWVNLIDKRWKEVQDGQYFYDSPPYPRAKGMVLSDARFDSEAEWIHSQGGIVIEVLRDEVDKINGIEGHASEAGINSCLIDYQVDNNKDLLYLYRALGDVMDLHYGS